MDRVCMKSKTTLAMHLTADQMEILVQIVIDESGFGQTRSQFNNNMLMMFEDVAGLETLSAKQSNRILNRLWSMYQHRRNTESRI
jgi:hypothetical protein